MTLLIEISIFIAALLVVAKGATLATTYSGRLARSYNLPKHTVGFIIVALIAIMPETLISINAAQAGVPELGLGTLFGSNIADLTLIFALLIILSRRGIRIESKVLHNVRLYPVFLALPLFLGSDGHYSRIDGVFLILAGCLFYYLVLRSGAADRPSERRSRKGRLASFLFLVLATALLLVGSHFTVHAATVLAETLGVTPILIGLLVVSLGTTMPELFYSLKAMKRKDDGLAIGDLLGSVLADATIVIGLLAVLHPFDFPVQIVYVTGAFMVFSAVVLLGFMRSGRHITKQEGYLLLFMWLSYALIELLANW